MGEIQIRVTWLEPSISNSLGRNGGGGVPYYLDEIISDYPALICVISLYHGG